MATTVSLAALLRAAAVSPPPPPPPPVTRSLAIVHPSDGSTIPAVPIGDHIEVDVTSTIAGEGYFVDIVDENDTLVAGDAFNAAAKPATVGTADVEESVVLDVIRATVNGDTYFVRFYYGDTQPESPIIINTVTGQDV